ncbi:MAG: type II toxin-antitoxin system PemK/MazF family toxin [Gammaproteobacteria bacterium]
MIKHGEIYLANLNPSKGTEPGKTRPVLIFQAQALLEVEHPSTIIIPLTTRIIKDAEPLRVHVTAQGNLQKDSDLLIDQIRAIDNRRLVGSALVRCNKKLMQKVYFSVKQVMGIVTNSA